MDHGFDGPHGRVDRQGRPSDGHLRSVETTDHPCACRCYGRGGDFCHAREGEAICEPCGMGSEVCHLGFKLYPPMATDDEAEDARVTLLVQQAYPGFFGALLDAMACD